MFESDTSTPDSIFGTGGFLGDFATSALQGLGLGSGQDAAKTFGGLIRGASASPASPPPAPVSTGPAVSLKKITPAEIAVLLLAGAVAAYLLVR